jgi:hypothetical protein
MTKRAQQFEVLAAGVMDSGSPIATGYVRFYEAGTTTLKNAYADKDKGSSFTKLALDADSRGVAYGDGVYKLKFYAGDPDNGGTDTGITIDNYKCTAVLGAIRTVTSADDIDRDDELVLVDTTSGNITVTLADVDTFDNPVTIKKIAAGNTVTIATTDSQNIITATAAQIDDKVLNENYVDDSAGGAYVNSTQFSLSGLTSATWQSIGPTDGGADHTWTALDDVPTDADWIEVKISSFVQQTGGAAPTTARTVDASVRKEGSSVVAGGASSVVSCACYGDSSNPGYDSQKVVVKIPVNSRQFEAYYVEANTNRCQCTMHFGRIRIQLMQYLPIPFTALDKSADKTGQSTWHQGQFDGYWQRHNTADGPKFLWTKRPGLTEFCDLGESAKVDGLHYWTRQDVLAASCNGKMFKVTETGTKTDITGTASMTAGNRAIFADVLGSNLYAASGGQIGSYPASGTGAYIVDAQAPTAVRFIGTINQVLVALKRR